MFELIFLIFCFLYLQLVLQQTNKRREKKEKETSW